MLATLRAPPRGSGATAPAAEPSRAGPAPGAVAVWPAFGYDATGSNDGPASTGITAANLRQLAPTVVHLPGVVDSSPVYVRNALVDGARHDVYVVDTSYGRTFAIDAASFLVSVAFVTGIQVAEHVRPARQRFLREIADGWREVQRHRWLTAGFLGFALGNVGIGIYLVLGPFVAGATWRGLHVETKADLAGLATRPQGTVTVTGGADDVSVDGSTFQVLTAAEALASVRETVAEAGFEIESAELTMLPKTTIGVEDENEAKKILRLIDQLEDNDDVQDVYANFDIPERVLEAVAG